MKSWRIRNVSNPDKIGAFNLTKLTVWVEASQLFLLVGLRMKYLVVQQSA